MKFLILSSILLSCFLAQSNPEDQAKQKELNRRLHEAVKNSSRWSYVSEYEAEREGIEAGSVENVNRLIAMGADPNSRDKDGRNIFAWVSRPSVTKVLLDAGADPNTVLDVNDPKKVLAIHLKDIPESIKVLVEGGADIHARDANGNTALHGKTDPEFIRAYLEAGADPNAQNSEGDAPLHVLPMNEKGFAAGRILAYNGADLDLKNNKGNIPFIVKSAPLAFKLKEESSCSYITKSSQIKPAQCGRKNVCIARMFCVFKLGTAPNTNQISKEFQVVCSSLSNGECPEANDCALDRSVVEAEEIVNIRNDGSYGATEGPSDRPTAPTEGPSDRPTAPKKSSSGVR